MQSPLIRAGNNTFSHTVHQLEHNPPDTLNPSYRFAKASPFSYNNQTISNHTPFYEKFIKKPAQQRNTDNVHTPLHNSSALEQKHKEKTIPHEKPAAPQHVQRHNNKPHAAYRFGTSVFSPLTAEAKRILEAFPEILAQVLPLDSQKKQQLPQHIHELFHELTDERSSRKTQYLNNPVKLSAACSEMVF